MAIIITNGKTLSHISDDMTRPIDIKTRCGRTLHFYSDGWAKTTCQRCGTPEDFETVHQEMIAAYNEEKTARDKARQIQVAKQAEKLEKHRNIINHLVEILENHGADNIQVNTQAAGSTVTFKVDGLVFKLNGNIWDK